ncbi:tetratricopeptide repeat protein 16-like, partial [Argonauta hians]
FKTGKIDKAIVLLNKAIAQEKTQIGLYLNRAECFYQTGDYNFALLDYKQAMELGDLDKKYYPRISELYYLLAKGYYSSGEFEDTRRAKEDILLSYFLDPNDKDIISVFKYLFPSTPGRGIFNSPLANEIKMKAKRLLSDPNIYQLAHQNKSLPDKNIVISTLCAEPLCVTGISTPPVHQVLNLAFKNRTPMLHLKGNNLCLEKQNTILPKTPSGGNFFELWNQSMNIPKRKTTDQKLIKEISREVSNFFD